MKTISEYINEKYLIDTDTEVDSDEKLTDEELNYKFKLITAGVHDVVKDIIASKQKYYGKPAEETAKKLKKLIPIDKLLYDNGFDRYQKVAIKEYGINGVYLITTKVNKRGYCVVWDPFDHLISSSGDNFIFLVGKCRNQTGKTINPIEWVEAKDFEKENHKYDNTKTPRRFYTTIEEAWKYIKTFGF